jgi:thiol:disulfide interchange protein DsbC
MSKSYPKSRRRSGLALAAVLAVLPVAGALAEGAAATPEVEQRLRNSLAVLLPNVQPDSVQATPLPGLYEVMFGPRLVYMSEDGRYLLQGSIIDLEKRENITEPRLTAAKARAIASVSEDRMVIYGPQDPKYVVTVFTDIDCGFCRKLHAEIDKYNANGIEIRYLFYPRAGENSESYQKAVSVWCADDRKAALTEAKLGEGVPQRSCENPVREHLALGRVMGLQGTPALVLEDGEMIPGYVPADRLKLLLEQHQAAAQ